MKKILGILVTIFLVTSCNLQEKPSDTPTHSNSGSSVQENTETKDTEKDTEEPIEEQLDFSQEREGKVSELNKILGFEVVAAEYADDTHYSMDAIDEKGYASIGIQSDDGGFSLLVKKVGNKWEEVWGGHDVMNEDCERIILKYSDLLDNHMFSDCAERVGKYTNSNDQIKEVMELRKFLQNFDISWIDDIYYTSFGWKEGSETYGIFGYTAKFIDTNDELPKLDTSKFKKLGWNISQENSSDTENMIIQTYKKDDEICQVVYNIKKGNSKSWTEAEVTISCGTHTKHIEEDEDEEEEEEDVDYEEILNEYGEEISADGMHFKAFGTEPFWNVTIKGEDFIFSDAQSQESKYRITFNKKLNYFLFGGESIGGKITRKLCTDSGKGDKHDYTIEFEIGAGDTYYGCADSLNTNHKNDNSDFTIGESGDASGLQKKLGFALLNGESDGAKYKLYETYENYYSFGITYQNKESFLIARKKGNNWENVWEGDTVDEDACKFIEFDYPKIMDWSIFSTCGETYGRG